MQDNRLAVCEVYPTIQGEGPNAGKPVIFIRLFGTNFKDKNDRQKYAYNDDPNNLEENRKIYSIEEFVDVIDKIEKGNIFHWVITGGEPMLQQTALEKAIVLFKERHNKKPFIEWETNGTLKPLSAVNKLSDLYQVQVKLSNSMDGTAQTTFSTRIKDDVIKDFVKNKKAIFIFTVGNDDHVKEVKEIASTFKIDAERIWLRPLGSEIIDLRKSMFYLWSICLKHNYRLTDRMHLMTFGPNKRGV